MFQLSLMIGSPLDQVHPRPDASGLSVDPAIAVASALAQTLRITGPELQRGSSPERLLRV
ncbi:Ferrous iron transport protein B [Nocardioides sp. PD653]|nr:Ferrous iron transport protein B [Nocardioides sp. PD653-B2]GAW55292.1 Ferrous iron transport protein B [Nocardioides sp. PD653]